MLFIKLVCVQHMLFLGNFTNFITLCNVILKVDAVLFITFTKYITAAMAS